MPFTRCFFLYMAPRKSFVLWPQYNRLRIARYSSGPLVAKGQSCVSLWLGTFMSLGKDPLLLKPKAQTWLQPLPLFLISILEHNGAWGGGNVMQLVLTWTAPYSQHFLCGSVCGRNRCIQFRGNIIPLSKTAAGPLLLHTLEPSWLQWDS